LRFFRTMTKFNYKVADKDGKIINGRVEASNLDQALSLLRRQSLYPIEINKTVSSKTHKGKLSKKEKIFRISFQKIRPRTINVFIRELSTLLEVGMPLLSALHSLESQTKEVKLKDIIGGLAEAVEEGEKFSQGLGRFPKVFGNLFQAMIRSAEATGSLEVVLRRLADYNEQKQRLKDRLKTALMYPTFVIMVAIIMLSILLIFVIPAFVNVFEEFGMQLPLATRILIAVSFFAGRWWPIILCACILVFFGTRSFFLKPFAKKQIDKIKLRLPLVGPLIRKAIIARIAQTLSALIANGVPILESLGIAADTAENSIFEEALSRSQDAVREGEDIAGTLAESKAFPGLVIDMIKVGEDSARLDFMLERIARDYEEKVEVSINGLASILEPVLIVILGIIIGFVVFAVFLPLMVLIKEVY